MAMTFEQFVELIRSQTVLTGDGVPSSALGNDFDYYVDQLARRFYRKIDGIWSSSAENVLGPYFFNLSEEQYNGLITSVIDQAIADAVDQAVAAAQAQIADDVAAAEQSKNGAETAKAEAEAAKQDVIEVANEIESTMAAAVAASVDAVHYGLTVVLAGNTVIVAPGRILDSAHTTPLKLTSSMSKVLADSWVVGDAANGLAAGLSLAANTWYHLFLIYNPTTGLHDLGFDSNIAATNLLACATGFIQFRRIWSGVTNASSVLWPLRQVGNIFRWTSTMVNLITTASISSSTRTLYTMSTPLGVEVLARLRYYIDSDGKGCCISSPLDTDLAVSSSDAPTNLIVGTDTVVNTSDKGASPGGAGEIDVLTNNICQIGIRSASGTVYVCIMTVGWTDPNLYN